MKWKKTAIGAGIGMMFGPIGAGIGAAIGRFFDSQDESNFACPHCQTELYIESDESGVYVCENCNKPFLFNPEEDDFLGFLAAIMAKMAKSDGRIDEHEAKYISKFMREVMDLDESKQQFFKQVIKDVKDDELDIYYYANVFVSFNNDEALLRDLYIILFEMAMADGVLEPAEEIVLKELPNIFGLRDGIFYELKEEFVGNNNENNELQFALEIFEITIDTPFSEIKSIYRSKVKDYHPDKLATVPEPVKKLAEKELQKINQAYDILKTFHKQ